MKECKPLQHGPLAGAHEVFIQGSWNRWNHAQRFGPTRMSPAATAPGGDGAAPALMATVSIPSDAHVMDFVFSDTAASGEKAGDYTRSLQSST